jgi:prepilin-type N-terminal cleavage/methylation domain-containing protein
MSKLKINNLKFKIVGGFTLIELLVVISIIGILAAMITVSFISSQRQARDVNRKSDLAQYRNALETYANQNGGLYPIFSGDIDPLDNTIFCTDLGLTNCPNDPEHGPSQGNYYYRYYSDDGTEYVLFAQLENVSSVSSKTYWVVCSNGISDTLTGNTPTSGACPL